jgi:hypothetical protein
MKIGDLVIHWVSKRIGVIVEIKNDWPSYRVQWLDQTINGVSAKRWGWYDEMRLDAVKKCP